MTGENKYGGHDVQADWHRIREGLSTNLVKANMGDVLKHRQAAKRTLEDARSLCSIKAYQCFERTRKRKYLDIFPLGDVLKAIKVMDRYELLEALRLKTAKGFADRLIKSHKFENE